MSRLALQTGARAGTISLVDGYRTATGLSLGQLYRSRPARLKPPSAYIDRITEQTTGFTKEESQRTVRVYLRIVWGVYDPGDSVDQRDRFIDGFYGHVEDNPHAFGANSLCTWLAVEDDENFQADWIDSTEPLYMTEITLEGFAST